MENTCLVTFERFGLKDCGLFKVGSRVERGIKYGRGSFWWHLKEHLPQCFSGEHDGIDESQKDDERTMPTQSSFYLFIQKISDIHT